MWNEQKRLSNKFEQYHMLNHSFRTTTKDLDVIKAQHMKEIHERDTKTVHNVLSETFDRQ